MPPPPSVLLAFVLLALPLVAVAQDSLKLPNPLVVKGEEYKNPIYSKHDAIWLSFIHDEGPAKVAISDLPEDLKAALSYDARLADEQSSKDAERDRAIAAMAAAKAADDEKRQAVLQGVLVKNTARGLLIVTWKGTGKTMRVSSWANGNKRLETSEEEVGQTVAYLVWGHPLKDVLKEKSDMHIKILVEGDDYLEGMPVTRAKYFGNLE